jgi:hypothetical protein
MNDKAQHAIVGAFAGIVAATVYAAFVVAFVPGLPFAGIIPVPFIGALIAGLTKEAADWLSPGSHTVDPWDVAATAAPGLVISIALAFAVM